MRLAEWVAQRVKRDKIKAAEVFRELAATSGVSLPTVRLAARGLRVGTFRVAKAISDATSGKVTIVELFGEEKGGAK